MFSITGTYALYNSLLIICPLLCYLADWKGKLSLRYFAYAILMFVAAIRFDIGADYENYYNSIERIIDAIHYSDISIEDFNNTEPTLYLFTYLFSWTKDPSIAVIGFYAFITITLFYKIFDYYNIHTLGILFFILSFVYFQTWDWMRQGLALAICLYGLRFVKENTLWKFTICIICATLTHYSALLIIFCYFFRKINIPPLWYGIGVILIIILAVLGFFQSARNFFFDIIPYYSDIYAGSDQVLKGGSTYTTTTYILVMLCFSFILLICPKEYSFEATLLFIGATLYGMSGGNLNMDRIAWYFTSTQVILLPRLYQYHYHTAKKYALVSMIFFYLIVFNGVYIYAHFRGCSPYETIWSEEYKVLYFRERVD